MHPEVDTNLYLEPIKYYNYFLKNQHLDNINACLDELVKQAGFNIVENKETVDAYNKMLAKSLEMEKNISKKQGFSTFLLIIGIILCPIIVGIFILIARAKKIKPQIAGLEEEKNKIDKEKARLLNHAKAQTQPLLDIISDETALQLAEKTAPILDFDERCEQERVEQMVEQFGLVEDEVDNHSTLVVQSGDLHGNPFILTQTYVMNLVPKTYTGSIVIHWTTTVHTKEGTRTVHHTQTLTASRTEDVPRYSVQSKLMLASDAAPKLSFKRAPSGLDGKSEKDVERYVKKFEKEDEKKAQKAIKKGESYTKMTNSKFEAYLNSSDRNNEVEYRLLFTPLAQNNICYMFSQDKPYGDDITFYKKGQISSLYSSHSANMDYSGGSYNYDSYDYEIIKKKFTDYNMSFFQGLYYDFAFFLSIPMYQQHIPMTFIPTHPTKRNVSSYETECLLNKIDVKRFAHPDTDTDVIVTTEVVSKGKDVDNINVIGHSFKAVPHTDMIPVLGGDGHTHAVPVHYYIYEPLTESTPMTVYKNAVPKGKEGIIMKYRNLYLANK